MMYKGNTTEIFPIPDPHLMRLSVSWADPERFIQRGNASYNKIISAFKESGFNPNQSDARFLEWGCGCGRITRHAIADGLNIEGVDISHEAIAWLKSNIDNNKFSSCAILPPLKYSDNSSFLMSLINTGS